MVTDSRYFVGTSAANVATLPHLQVSFILFDPQGSTFGLVLIYFPLRGYATLNGEN